MLICGVQHQSTITHARNSKIQIHKLLSVHIQSHFNNSTRPTIIANEASLHWSTKNNKLKQAMQPHRVGSYNSMGEWSNDLNWNVREMLWWPRLKTWWPSWRNVMVMKLLSYFMKPLLSFYNDSTMLANLQMWHKNLILMILLWNFHGDCLIDFFYNIMIHFFMVNLLKHFMRVIRINNFMRIW